MRVTTREGKRSCFECILSVKCRLKLAALVTFHTLTKAKNIQSKGEKKIKCMRSVKGGRK